MALELLEVLFLTLISLTFAFALGMALGTLIWRPVELEIEADAPNRERLKLRSRRSLTNGDEQESRGP